MQAFSTGFNPDYQREIYAFEEKICLAELEEAKAHQRVKELQFQKARFNMEVFLNTMKQQQADQAKVSAPISNA
jgi:hypothetical protein